MDIIKIRSSNFQDSAGDLYLYGLSAAACYIFLLDVFKIKMVGDQKV